MIRTYLKERRWFRAKSRGLVSAAIEETFPLLLDAASPSAEEVTLCIVLCTYEDGGSDRYVMAMATASGAEAARIKTEQPHLVVGEASPALLHAMGRSEAVPASIVYDALGSERLLAPLLRLFDNGGTRVEGRGGAAAETVVFRPFPGFAASAAGSVTPRPTKGEQTNTSIVFGDSFILKVVRKLDEGASAELEMGEFLTQHGYSSSPQVVGAIELERAGGGKSASTVGILHRFVANQGDAWTFTLKELDASRSPERYLPHAALLGRRLGELHVVLAAGAEPEFALERLGKSARAKLAATVMAESRALGQWLREGDASRIEARVAAFVDLAEDPVAMRVHGDLHLGQILWTGDDFVLIDFEGEPARTLEERKAKRSPLADVAGMLRSFDYAAAIARGAASTPAAAAWSPEAARAWWRAVASEFLKAYRTAIGSCAALRMDDESFRKALDLHLLEKTFYELAYEANNRPDWIAVPRDGLRDLLDSTSAP
jgi:trehalose synthase-fused probable maltokinase